MARFDGGRLSLNAGILLVVDVEHWLGTAGRLERGIEDPHAPVSVASTATFLKRPKINMPKNETSSAKAVKVS